MLKYYLRGLGIGIVVTTIILTIVFNFRGKLSDSEIKERASKLGMVMAQTTEDSIFDKTVENTDEETTDKPTQKQTQTQTGSEKETTEASTEESTTEAVTEETTTETPTEKPTPEPVTEPPATEPPAPVNTANIEIRSGMYSEVVSRMLFNAGIIPNAAEFNLYLENNGYAERIAVGTFTVSSDMSYDQLARIITRS